MLLSRFKIVGHSMMPGFSENDNVLASSAPFILRKPRIGDVVIFEKDKKQFVKRINKIDNGKYCLLGDNKNDSKDSRNFGLIERDQIKGKVILKI